MSIYYYTDQDTKSAAAIAGRWQAFYTMLGAPKGGFDPTWPIKIIQAAKAKGLNVTGQINEWEKYEAAFKKSEADPAELQARAQDLSVAEKQADEKGLYSFEIDVGQGKERRNAPPQPPAQSLAPHPAERVLPKAAQELSDLAAKVDKGKIGPGVPPGPPDSIADTVVRVVIVGAIGGFFALLAYAYGKGRG